LKDEPGRLEQIHKSRLQIDLAYQRESTPFKIKNIARDWSWIACGALIVARRREGLFVVDGQHRLAAAMNRADITHLPCIIFASESVQQEAAGFLNANTNRKPLTTLQQFKALVEVKDAAALEVQRLIASAGYTISVDDTKRSVRCLGALLNCVRIDKDAFSRTWPAVLAAANGAVLHQRAVKGLFWIERHADEDSLSDPKWLKRLALLGQTALVDAANKAAVFYETGDSTVWGKGILEVINRRVQTKFNVIEIKKGEK